MRALMTPQSPFTLYLCCGEISFGSESCTLSARRVNYNEAVVVEAKAKGRSSYHAVEHSSHLLSWAALV